MCRLLTTFYQVVIGTDRVSNSSMYAQIGAKINNVTHSMIPAQWDVKTQGSWLLTVSVSFLTILLILGTYCFVQFNLGKIPLCINECLIWKATAPNCNQFLNVIVVKTNHETLCRLKISIIVILVLVIFVN